LQLRSRVSLAADPLKKVKDLIHSLIVRLQKEARSEAELHGSCTEQLASAMEYKKNNQADMMDALLQGRELVDQLQTAATDINTLTSELSDLEDSMKNATDAYKEADEAFATDIKTQKFTAEKVNGAITILTEYYTMQANKAEVGTAAGDAQTEAYSGSTATSDFASSKQGGIITLLKNIEEEAATAAKDAQKAKDDAHAAYVEANRDNLALKKSKETDRINRKEDLVGFKKAYQAAKAVSQEAGQALDTNLDVLQKLHKLCKVADAVSSGKAGIAERKAAHDAKVKKIADQITDLEAAKTALSS